ncbi:MAG: hypothetical protein H0X49_02675, partial [Acidobacteria bacterium]|nr:hypothetical protein [Acidobacteriota bacterium]
MKKIALLSFIILALTFMTFGQKAKTVKVKTTTVTVTNDKGVRDVFDRLVEGIKQIDAEKVMSVYQNSDKILFFNNNGSATIGWETMKTN